MVEQNNVVEKKPKQTNSFRFAEKCLYEYKKNLARLDVLRGDLAILRSAPSPKVQDFRLDDIILSVGGHSDPVMARLIRMEQLENEIVWLERWTKPIMRFIDDIKRSRPAKGSERADYLILMHVLYFENKNMEDAERVLKASRSVIYRKRRGLIKNICQYLGL